MLNKEGLHYDDRRKAMKELGGNSRGDYVYYEPATDKYWIDLSAERYMYEITKASANSFKRTIVDSKRGTYYHKAEF